MEEKLQIKKNFDLVERKLLVAEQDACLYFVDGFVKDEVLEKLMEFFRSLKAEDLEEKDGGLKDTFVPYVEVELLTNLEDVVHQLLSGVACLFVDGFGKCLAEIGRAHV